MELVDRIVNELIIASRLLHTNSISGIAEQIGYRPMLIITALYRGVETGKFKHDKKNGTIAISEDVAVDKLAVTEGIMEISGLIEDFITYRNTADERDETIGDLWSFLGGVPELHVQMAVMVSPKLATYEIVDPKDKQSSYTFVSLKENADKLWGQKAFKTKGAAKRAQAALKRAKK